MNSEGPRTNSNQLSNTGIRVPLSCLLVDKSKVSWADAVWKDAFGAAVPAALPCFGSAVHIQRERKPLRNTGWTCIACVWKAVFSYTRHKKKKKEQWANLAVLRLTADQSGDDAANRPVVCSSCWQCDRDIDIPPLGWKYVDLTHLLLSTLTK